ncbi:MAG: hypothetical protein ACWGQW_08855, partial [bacterium]
MSRSSLGRYFLNLLVVLAFGFGLTGLGTSTKHLQPLAHWTEQQLAAFPDASGQSATIDTESLQPLILAMADFDGDGVPDLLVGYARQNEGVLLLHPGNIGCYRPNSPEALQHRSEGTWSDAPFLSPPRMIEISTMPEFLLAGDFNGDLKNDVVFGSQNENKVVMLAGNGQGSFESEMYLELPGPITTVSSGEVGRHDGHEDLLVGIDSPSGPQLLLFQSMEGAFSADPAVLDLPERAEKIVVGQMVGDYQRDFVVAAREFLVIVDGRSEQLEGKFDSGQIDEYSFSAAITDLVAGDFRGDPQQELVVLTSDGYLTHLEMGEGDISDKGFTHIHTLRLFNAAKQLRLLRSGRLTGSKDDLLLLNRQSREASLLDLSNPEESFDASLPISRTFLFPVEPVFVLSAPLNLDAQEDLVLIGAGSTTLDIALTQPLDGTFVVNQTGGYQDADTSDGVCDTNLSEEGNQCSFTAAVQQANASSDLNTITFTVNEATIGLLSIKHPVTIDGGGVVTISGGLTIEGGSSTVSGVSVPYVHLIGKGGNQISDSIVGYITIDRSSNNTILGNTISDALSPYGIRITDSLDYQNVTQITEIRIEG